MDGPIQKRYILNLFKTRHLTRKVVVWRKTDTHEEILNTVTHVDVVDLKVADTAVEEVVILHTVELEAVHKVVDCKHSMANALPSVARQHIDTGIIAQPKEIRVTNV